MVGENVELLEAVLWTDEAWAKATAKTPLQGKMTTVVGDDEAERTEPTQLRAQQDSHAPLRHTQ